MLEGVRDGECLHSDTMIVKHDEQYRTEHGRLYVPGENPTEGSR